MGISAPRNSSKRWVARKGKCIAWLAEGVWPHDVEREQDHVMQRGRWITWRREADEPRDAKRQMNHVAHWVKQTTCQSSFWTTKWWNSYTALCVCVCVCERERERERESEWVSVSMWEEMGGGVYVCGGWMGGCVYVGVRGRVCLGVWGECVSKSGGGWVCLGVWGGCVSMFTCRR